MPRIIGTVVHGIEELSDEAKEAARSWYRQTGPHDDWYDFVFEDFETICRILGISLRTSPVKLMGGGTRQNPHIFFRGFSSQGDGASFEGQLSHAKGATRAIRSHAPQDAAVRLHALSFFKRDAPFVEKVPDRRRAGRDPTLGRKPFGDLMKRDVRRLSDKVKNERFMRIKLRAPRLALLARRDLTVVAITAIPFPRRRDTNTKALGRFARRKTFQNRFKYPPSQVRAETMGHVHLLENQQRDRITSIITKS